MVGLLIRHGHTDAVGQWLAGRRPGLSLNALGRREAQGVAQSLRQWPIAAIYSSPLERALETAAPLARDRGLKIQTREALTDVDFGDWTGRTLAELADEPAWTAFNADRQHARAPAGESLVEVQERVVNELLRLSRAHAGELIAIVTHAETIRCAVAAFDDVTLDQALAIEISPAHVSAVGIAPNFRRVMAVNVSAELVTP